MGYREIPENKILKFPATPGFKGWKAQFTEGSITHPAKMNLRLLSWIIGTYTKPGDIVLDPMAGTGSTIILAAMLGRHAIAVEYEPQFCDMIRENIKRTQPQTTLTPKGRMICIQGDARELSKLLGESDAIITSPPYGEAQSGGGIAMKGYNGPKHSPTDLVGERSYMPDKFEGEGNISRLKYGKVDTVVTSPPYSLTREGSDRIATGIDVKTGKSLWSKTGSEFSEGNIQKLPHGDVDTVVTSPPYEGSVPAYDEKWLEEHWDDKSDSPKHKTMRFGKSMRGYPKKVDAVVSSPPYGNRLADDVVQDGDEARMSYRQAIDSIITSPPSETIISSKSGGPLSPKEKPGLKVMREYSENSDNIGNLKSESYLEAMLQVYRECHKILKKTGVMVLVTKNFIRNKQVIRLDLDTIKLCEAAGFRLSDRWYFKLPTMSFWRILYRRKYPDTSKVEYEDVLVFKKKI